MSYICICISIISGNLGRLSPNEYTNIEEYKQCIENTSQSKFIDKLFENKMLTIRASENVVRILPPLNVSKKEIYIALKIIRKVCKHIK